MTIPRYSSDVQRLKNPVERTTEIPDELRGAENVQRTLRRDKIRCAPVDEGRESRRAVRFDSPCAERGAYSRKHIPRSAGGERTVSGHRNKLPRRAGDDARRSFQKRGTSIFPGQENGMRIRIILNL